MNHVELFSGIGGFRRAMDLVSKDTEIAINTIAFSEIDKKATDTYKSNFCTEGEIEIGDIVSFTQNKDMMDNFPDYDILSGGFPCQTFSVMGEQKGFHEERGQMFFRIMDMINQKHPRYILLENVKNIARHDKGRTLKVVLKELNDAGYIVHYDIFNSCEFGLPQTRRRVMIFGRLEEYGDFDFSNKLVTDNFKKINKEKCSLNVYDTVVDVLEKKAEEKYYLSERIKPTILSDGSANFRSNSDIDQIIARTLTASMHKMHRACQDNYYSDVFIKSGGKKRPSETMSKEALAKLRIRKLTPKEAFMLQGFPSDFAEIAQGAGVSNTSLYKQSGNAVSVNTVYAVMHYLITNNLIHE